MCWKPMLAPGGRFENQQAGSLHCPILQNVAHFEFASAYSTFMNSSQIHFGGRPRRTSVGADVAGAKRKVEP